jgi:hypothetical protein
MKSKIISIISIVSISILFVSWSGTGHDFINSKVWLSYNPMMNSFYSWAAILQAHGGDADDRKSWDDTEAPKHYIDIDLYPEFLEYDAIPQEMSQAIAIHGSTFVYDEGILPWATLAMYDSVKNCLQRRNFDQAVLYAADMGHYVADGHMPLHITSNYNGQNTDNDGIHSRYESTMVSANLSKFIYDGDSVEIIDNVSQYIFNYLYHNNTYVDTILEADNYAKSINSNTYSSAYKQALWEKTGNLTIRLFKNSSHALSELIYNAWLEAGSPELPTGVVLIDYQNTKTSIKNYPNPFQYSTQIEFSLFENANVSIQIFDAQGKVIETLVNNEFKTQGLYNFQWNSRNFPKGNYYLVLHTNNSREIKKITIL